jgi:hypothetical protein
MNRFYFFPARVNRTLRSLRTLQHFCHFLAQKSRSLVLAISGKNLRRERARLSGALGGRGIIHHLSGGCSGGHCAERQEAHQGNDNKAKTQSTNAKARLLHISPDRYGVRADCLNNFG